MSTNKQRKPYKRITPQTVAIHQAEILLQGNGSQAVRTTDPDYKAPHDRSYRILKKAEEESTLQYIDRSLEIIGEQAINRLGELVNSTDEKVAGVNTRYAIDHIKGKAVQKSVSLTGKINIQSVLD